LFELMIRRHSENDLEARHKNRLTRYRVETGCSPTLIRLRDRASCPDVVPRHQSG
jgi:hypothetical protein